MVYPNRQSRARRRGPPYGGGTGFTPSLLNPTVWYDPSTISSLYQDDEGASSVTASGQVTGLVLDRSQNYVRGNEEFRDPGFSTDITGDLRPIGTNLSISGGQMTVVNNNTFAGRWTDTGLNIEPGKNYEVTFTVDALTGGNNAVFMAVGDQNLNNNPGAGQQGQIFPSVGVGTHTFIIVNTVGATANRLVGTFNQTGGGSAGHTLSQFSVRELPSHHAFQTTSANRPTYQTGNDLFWLQNDQTNDQLDVVLPSLGPNATEFWADENGATINGGLTIAAGTRTLPTSTRLYSYGIINRALNETDTTELRNYLNRLSGRQTQTLLERTRSAMSVRKVDFIGIGDSNLIFGGNGWDDGMQDALSQDYPMYSTGLMTLTENQGNGVGTGLNGSWTRRNGGASFMDFTGAPERFESRLESGTLFPHYYGYVPTGESKTTTGHGISIPAASVLDVNADLRYEMWYGGFGSDNGSFDLSIRRGNSPFTTLTSSDPVNTNTGVQAQMAKASVSLPAATRDYPLEMLSSNNSRNIVGPFFATYQRVRNVSRTNGWSWSNLSFRGGQPLRTHAQALQTIDDNALVHFLQVVRDGQEDQDDKQFVIVVNSGLNELNENVANASLGPNPAPGGSPEALVDNFEAIRIRVEGVWVAQGWDLSELDWLFFVSHPISSPDNSTLVSYRTAIATHFSNNIPRGETVDVSSLTTSTEMLSNGWYNSGGSDRNHLTSTGYRGLAPRILGLT